MLMPARTALPPNAKFGLSDWSYWSSGLMYVSGTGPISMAQIIQLPGAPNNLHQD